MKQLRMLLLIVMILILSVPAVYAGDFEWMPDFNVRANADPGEFRAHMAARFRVGDATIKIVLSNVSEPADAYMVFRLGEMSGHDADYVLHRYKSHKGKGWGVLAKSLGIKPGSKEFHALKRSDDLYGGESKGKGKSKKKWKNKD